MPTSLKQICSLRLFVAAMMYCNFALAEEVLRYNIGTSGSSPPYENAINENRAGILVETLPLIMDRAGLKIEYDKPLGNGLST